MREEEKIMAFLKRNIHLSIENSKIRIGHGTSIKVLKKIANLISYSKQKTKKHWEL